MLEIPKVIIQTSRNPPNIYRVAKIKELCEGWEYKHYNDHDIINFFLENPDLNFPDIANIFNKIKIGPHRADFFRYYYLYKKGGVYMDTDLMLNTSIEEIIQNYKFVSVTTNPKQVFNGFIASTCGHDIVHQAFTDIYKTFSHSSNFEQLDYHTFCCRLMSIINRFRDHSVNMLPEYIDDDAGISTIKDVHNKPLLFHYFKTKEFPVTFLTKRID